MYKSKLIEILRTFNKEELKSFNDFIRSPYYNKRKELHTFYDYLHQCAPQFEKEAVDRHLVFKKIAPKQEYDEKWLGYMMSYLNKLAEQFIQIKQYEKDQAFQNYNFLSALVKRNLSKFYQQQKIKIEQNTDIVHESSSDFFLRQYLMADVSLQFRDTQHQRKHDQSLQSTTDYLDYFYLTTKLRNSCEMLNRKRVVAGDYELKLIDDLLIGIENSDSIQEPIIAIYLNLYQLLKAKENATNFTFLKNLVNTYSSNLQREEALKIYKLIINYCLRMIRVGKNEYVEEALELFLTGIEKEIFFESGYLSPWDYTNVIKLSLILKRYDWIESFIQEFNEKLPPDFRENALHYNLAELYYSKKELDKALEQLLHVKFSDIILHLGSREILAKIYYEKEEEEALLSLLASFSIFLKRDKKMAPNIKKTFLNFCDLLNQLMRRNPKKLPIIYEKIKTTQPLSSRSWLLQIAEEIMKDLKIAL